jgi:hypothetical protein
MFSELSALANFYGTFAHISSHRVVRNKGSNAGRGYYCLLTITSAVARQSEQDNIAKELAMVMAGVGHVFTLEPMNERARRELPRMAQRKTKTIYGVSHLKYALGRLFWHRCNRRTDARPQWHARVQPGLRVQTGVALNCIGHLFYDVW